MWGDHDGWHWGGWLLMTLTMLVFWGLVAWAVVSLVRRGQEPAGGAPPPREPDAEEILRRRFANGEIEEDEYRARLETLRGGPPAAPPR